MNTTNNNPALDFVCYPHSSMGRERCVLIAKEDIARSERRVAAATTRMGILSAGKRKKSWRKRKITYAIRDIRSEYLATPKGSYAVVGQYANLFPYEREVITLFEKDTGSQAIEKEMNIQLTKEEVIASIAGRNLETIALGDNLNAAKTEIEKAIDEISKKENIKLRNEDMEELANLSILLLKKISEQI